MTNVAFGARVLRDLQRPRRQFGGRRVLADAAGELRRATLIVMSDDGHRPGERLFEAYLDEHGYPPRVHEPDLGIKRRPDYLVHRNGEECVCEVKEFEETPGRSLRGRGGGTRSMEVVLQPVRNKIRAAARQLKPLADSGMPLVVVLANPVHAVVPLGPREIVWAMYGDPAFRFAVDPRTGGPADDGRFIVTRNGKLRNDHPYISAILVVSEREHAVDFYEQMAARNAHLTANAKMDLIYGARDAGEVPEGSYHRVDVFTTMSPAAVPLPDTLFDGPNDRRFEFDATAGAYVNADVSRK